MEYIEILSQKDMDELLNSVKGFHDSMTKEIHIINRGHVNPDHSMTMSHKFDGRLLIQSQWKPFAIELLFCNNIRWRFSTLLSTLWHIESPEYSHSSSCHFMFGFSCIFLASCED